MNKDYKSMLNEEIVERVEDLKKKVPGTEESKVATDELCKLIDRSIKIEEVENQKMIQKKKSEDEVYMKELDIKHDTNKTKIDNGVKVGILVGSMVFTAGMGAFMTVFEKDDNASFTMTKEMFKKSLSFFRLS